MTLVTYHDTTSYDNPHQRRHALACKLGFPSYAHRFTADKMAGSPERVIEFLTSLAGRVKVRVRECQCISSTSRLCPSVYRKMLMGLTFLMQGKANEELAVLRRAKFQHEGTEDFHQWYGNQR